MNYGPKTVKVPVYLQVEPELSPYGRGELAVSDVRDAKVVNATQARPKKPKPGTIVVKVTLEVPKAAFLPLAPEALVVIPESLTTPHPITVDATDPNEE